METNKDVIMTEEVLETEADDVTETDFSEEPELTPETSKFQQIQDKFNLNDNELLELMNFAIDVKNNGITDKYYSRLPKSFKTKIDFLCMKANTETGSHANLTDINGIKNQLAKELVEELKEIMFHDKAFEEYEKEYKEIIDSIENEPDVFEKYMNASSHNFKETILKTADKYKESDPEKYERIMSLSDTYQEAFNLKYIITAYENSTKIRKESLRDINNIKKPLDLFNFLFKRENCIGPGKNVVRIYNELMSNLSLPFTEYQKRRFISVVYEVVKNYDVTKFNEYSKIFFTLENIEAVAVSDMKKDANINLKRFMDNMQIIIDTIM